MTRSDDKWGEAIAEAKHMVEAHYPSHREYKVARAFLDLAQSKPFKECYGCSSPTACEQRQYCPVSATEALDHGAAVDAVSRAFGKVRSDGIPQYAEWLAQALWNAIRRELDALPSHELPPMTASDFRLLPESQKYGAYASACRNVGANDWHEAMAEISNLRRQLEAKPSSMGAPVAWRTKRPERGHDYWIYYEEEPRYPEDGPVEPLYAAPVSAIQHTNTPKDSKRG